MWRISFTLSVNVAHVEVESVENGVAIVKLMGRYSEETLSGSRCEMKKLEVSTLMSMKKSQTVMVVSSCWVKTYEGLQLSASPATCHYLNPTIPETDYILTMYSELVPPPVIQNVRASWYSNIEEEKMRNRVTVDELIREDPRNQTNVRCTDCYCFRIFIGRPWYLPQCHDCMRKIFNGHPHVYCAPPPSGEPEHYSYYFRMLISDNTGTLTLACFSNRSHSMVTECDKVVSEQGQTDPYTLPSVLIQ